MENKKIVKGLVRLEMTCPHCGKKSFQSVLAKNFTWDCPHCEKLNHFDFERGYSLKFEDMPRE
jgi:ribosomal protein L37AE/L43A